MRRLAHFAAVLAWGISGCGSAHSPTVPAAVPPQGDLRVMTFNVNFGTGHLPGAAKALAEIDADIVLLQETTAASEVAFRADLGRRYPHVVFRECCRAGGLGLMSKYPVLTQEYLEPTEGWFPAWKVVLSTPHGPVQTLNVHLRPPVSDSGSWVTGYFSTRDDRRREIEAFYDELGEDLPTIVAGDFNENASGQAVDFLSVRGFQSALPQVQRNGKTWHWQTKVGTIKAMLDHIVYDSTFELVDAEVVEAGPSDHYPLVATLRPVP